MIDDQTTLVEQGTEPADHSTCRDSRRCKRLHDYDSYGRKVRTRFSHLRTTNRSPNIAMMPRTGHLYARG